MKLKSILLITLGLLLFSPAYLHAQRSSLNENVDYPNVPRISAYEAYVKYKSGKAILFHAGGNNYADRHIVGAYNLDVKNPEPILRKFPKQGIDIFTYCY